MTIEPDFLDQLDRFRTGLDRETTALRQGDRESPRVGEGLTFSDYRRYSPGDDTRRIDWKLYGRTEELFIKQYEEERSLTVHVLVDASGSMDFGEGPAHKFEYGAKLGLGVAYLTARDNEQFRFSLCRESDADRLDAGRSTRGEVLDLIDQVNATTPAGEADLRATLAAYAARIQTRSVAVVVSDCLAAPETIADGVVALARTGADVVVVRPVAPAERDPDVAGDTLFVDPETDAEQRSYFRGAFAREYRERLEAHVERVTDRVLALGAEHVLVDTGTDYFESLADVWLR